MRTSGRYDSSATLAHAVRDLSHEPPVWFLTLLCDHVLQRFQRRALMLVQSTTTTTERRERMSNGPAVTILLRTVAFHALASQTESWTRGEKIASIGMQRAMESTFIHTAGVELSRCLLVLFVRKRDEKSKLFCPEPCGPVWWAVWLAW